MKRFFQIVPGVVLLAAITVQAQVSVPEISFDSVADLLRDKIYMGEAAGVARQLESAEAHFPSQPGAHFRSSGEKGRLCCFWKYQSITNSRATLERWVEFDGPSASH